MTKTTLFTLLVGLALVAGDQSEWSSAEQPMDGPENHVGESRVETPQVVLQLKYDNGELNKIYLAQFRNKQTGWEPSVPARTNLCADLCHAGLGGAGCGATCSDMLPVGLQAALRSPVEASTVYGEPRIAVCPTLCENRLGEPLCNCSASSKEVQTSQNSFVDWTGVCDAFCETDGYTIGGCPACERGTTPAQARLISTRILNTADGWTAWCTLQCRQGHGGAACNCNRSPLQ